MDKVVLIVHGLGGSSEEMQDIANAVQKTGVEVSLVTLPGHGASLKDFEHSRFSEWFEHVHREYLKFVDEGKEVIICGFSLGGVLALKLAQVEKVFGLIAIASPLYLCKIHPYFTSDWRLFFAPLVAKFKKVEYVSKRTELAQKIAPWTGHDEAIFPEQIADFMDNLVIVRKGLTKITAPLLFIQDYRDEICNIYNASYIMNNISSHDTALHILRINNDDAGHHLIVCHEHTRHIVANDVASFVMKLLNNNNLSH